MADESIGDAWLVDSPRRAPLDLSTVRSIEKDGRVYREGMPEWPAEVREAEEELSKKPPDPFSKRAREIEDANDALEDIYPELAASYLEQIALVDPSDRDTRKRWRQELELLANGGVPDRLKAISGWWDRFTHRERTPSNIAIVRAELITPVLRGPQPKTDAEWLNERAELLALHCQQDKVSPIGWTRGRTAAMCGYSPKSNGNARAHGLYEHGYRLHDLQVEAWRIMGSPPRLAE